MNIKQPCSENIFKGADFLNTVGLKKRTKIRIASYLIALIAVLSVWGTVQTVKMMNYAKELTVAHQRTIASLASYIDTLENDLRKMQYVNTSAMASGLSFSLCRASAGAKNCLSELNAGDTQLNTINKFLTQANDYVQSVNKKAANGQEISENDHAQLAMLYEYASQLSDQISYMEEVMLSGSIDFEDTVSTLSSLTDMGDLSISYSDAVTDAEKSFSDYPTLIYDGPFADNILQRESELLKNEKEISSKEAKRRASEYSGIEENRLIAREDEKGKIPAFVFYYEGTSVAVTRNGGYLLYLLSDKFAGEVAISEQEAIETAEKYLQKLGYSSMKNSYYFDNDGICTINFAYTLNDVICYSDLIKVSVSLDKGEIVSADCTGYLMNHKSRTIPQNIIDENTAKKSVSKSLTVKKTQFSFIPMEDGNEIFTYEFLCSDKNGTDVLVYIDAISGTEADIKILLYSDGGILTR